MKLLFILFFACQFRFIWAAVRFFNRQNHTRRTVLGAILWLQCTLVDVLYLGHPLAHPFIAVFLYSVAFELFWLTIRTHSHTPLATCFSEKEEVHLVKNGPYRIIRHPFYAAYLLMWLALPAAGGTELMPWLVFFVMLSVYTVAARVEEKAFLAGPLGEEYHQYRQSTGFLLPRVNR